LIFARVVQGLGAAMASATGLSILAAAFPEGKERNRALSVFGAASGSGFAAGMILGGVITATLGWRWVFDINVPIGLVVFLLSIKYISRTMRRTYEHKHLDIFGAVSVTAGLMLLVYSLSSAQNIGIGSLQTLELLLLSVIVLAAFLLIEYRSKAPLMPLGFLRRSSIFGANAVGLLQFAAFVGMVFILNDGLLQFAAFVGMVFILNDRDSAWFVDMPDLQKMIDLIQSAFIDLENGVLSAPLSRSYIEIDLKIVLENTVNNLLRKTDRYKEKKILLQPTMRFWDIVGLLAKFEILDERDIDIISRIYKYTSRSVHIGAFFDRLVAWYLLGSVHLTSKDKFQIIYVQITTATTNHWPAAIVYAVDGTTYGLMSLIYQILFSIRNSIE
jgi:Major Facilitator Superfamily